MFSNTRSKSPNKMSVIWLKMQCKKNNKKPHRNFSDDSNLRNRCDAYVSRGSIDVAGAPQRSTSVNYDAMT